MTIKHAKLALLLAGVLASGAAAATTYTDNFSSTKASLDWKALNYACLTAGGGTGAIPACTAPNDTAGYGALRLTPAANFTTGAILSNFTFPSNQGMQVTFTTYTYGGDKGGTAQNGADGITFLLTDGTKAAPTVAGASGGSMGYSCSNGNPVYEGLANAYLGLGIDEFGNFLNSGDNTDSGIYNSNSASGSTLNGTNTFKNNVTGGAGGGTGPYYQPERIGLRGAGNTTWAWLNSQNSDYYSGNVADAGKTRTACETGQYVSSGKKDSKNLKDIPFNYAVIPGGYRVLPNSQPIASNAAQTRLKTDNTQNAWPITYKLTLSPAGLLNFSYSYNNGAFQPVLVNSSITAYNGPIPASFRFGFSAGTGGSNNVHEITCFEASPLQSNSSAAANTVQTGQVKTGTQIYLASYSSDSWWGSLVSEALVADSTTGALSVSAVATWDGKCVLTGGDCASMATTNATTGVTTTPSVAVQSPSTRVLLTASDATGAAGLPLQWASLTTTQRTALNQNAAGAIDTAGSTRVSWLRGIRSTEQLASPTAGLLRARVAVLGDIIDSSPTWVGGPSAGNYPDAFGDGVIGSAATVPENATGAQTYSAFVTANASRQNIVYVGSNDGFLHGFRTGLYDSSGYNGTTNDGREVIGFMPSGVLAKQATEVSDPLYAHDYLVDATPGVGDLFYANKWHTWLVGGVGTSGSEMYALDVTDPTQFSEANASTLVLGDWNNTTLTHLAQTVGTPIIARLHNGQWAIVFGNGIGGNQTAGIYVGLVNSGTGAVSYQFLDTGVGSSSSPNGIAYVRSVDLDGDNIADYFYAGDLQGNIWRFDVTSATTADWSKPASRSVVFVAKDNGSPSKLQPISTAVVVASVKTADVDRVMVFFGTGQKTPTTTSAGDTYAPDAHTFYGIWDWNMTAWNGKSSVKYAALASPQTVNRAAMLVQTLASQTIAGASGQVLGYRTMPTGKVVCWSGTTTCATGNTKFGWLFDLPDTHEQIIYSPSIVDGAVVVSTAIPPTISALQCNAGLQSGWTMAFNPASGGGLPQSFFPGADGSFSATTSGATVTGIRLDAVGTPTTVRYGGKTYLVTQTVKGSAALSQVNPPNGDDSARVSWREVKL
ncbi:MAG: PilC/PilY family type IV pilus protein [Herbaspirillum sp.]